MWEKVTQGEIFEGGEQYDLGEIDGPTIEFGFSFISGNIADEYSQTIRKMSRIFEESSYQVSNLNENTNNDQIMELIGQSTHIKQKRMYIYYFFGDLFNKCERNIFSLKLPSFTEENPSFTGYNLHNILKGADSKTLFILDVSNVKPLIQALHNNLKRYQNDTLHILYPSKNQKILDSMHQIKNVEDFVKVLQEKTLYTSLGYQGIKDFDLGFGLQIKIDSFCRASQRDFTENNYRKIIKETLFFLLSIFLLFIVIHQF